MKFFDCKEAEPQCDPIDASKGRTAGSDEPAGEGDCMLSITCRRQARKACAESAFRGSQEIATFTLFGGRWWRRLFVDRGSAAIEGDCLQRTST